MLCIILAWTENRTSKRQYLAVHIISFSLDRMLTEIKHKQYWLKVEMNRMKNWWHWKRRASSTGCRRGKTRYNTTYKQSHNNLTHDWSSFGSVLGKLYSIYPTSSAQTNMILPWEMRFDALIPFLFNTDFHQNNDFKSFYHWTVHIYMYKSN